MGNGTCNFPSRTFTNTISFYTYRHLHRMIHIYCIIYSSTCLREIDTRDIHFPSFRWQNWSSERYQDCSLLLPFPPLLPAPPPPHSYSVMKSLSLTNSYLHRAGIYPSAWFFQKKVKLKIFYPLQHLGHDSIAYKSSCHARGPLSLLWYSC